MTRKIIITTLAFSIFIFSCKGKQDNSNFIKSEETLKLSKPKKDSIIEETKIIKIGYIDNYEKLPKLTFEKISEKEFLKYKYIKKIDTQNVEEDSAKFYLTVKNRKIDFKKETNKNYGNRDGENWEQYIGYYPELKMYVITHNSVSESLDFGELSLLDSLTGVEYKIISVGDWYVETPIPSINNKYIAYYYNMEYEENESFIAILKVNNSSFMF